MSKKRGVLVWCLFGLATILMFVSSLTVWSKRQLLDDQAWADSSTQLLANDAVRGAIAQKLSDALFQRVDVEAQLRTTPAAIYKRIKRGQLPSVRPEGSPILLRRADLDATGPAFRKVLRC